MVLLWNVVFERGALSFKSTFSLPYLLAGGAGGKCPGCLRVKALCVAWQSSAALVNFFLLLLFRNLQHPFDSQKIWLTSFFPSSLSVAFMCSVGVLLHNSFPSVTPGPLRFPTLLFLTYWTSPETLLGVSVFFFCPDLGMAGCAVSVALSLLNHPITHISNWNATGCRSSAFETLWLGFEERGKERECVCRGMVFSIGRALMSPKKEVCCTASGQQDTWVMAGLQAGWRKL